MKYINTQRFNDAFNICDFNRIIDRLAYEEKSNTARKSDMKDEVHLEVSRFGITKLLSR
jgi:hypothetical protein